MIPIYHLKINAAMDLDRCLKVGWLNMCLRRSLRCQPSSQKVQNVVSSQYIYAFKLRQVQLNVSPQQ